MGTLKIDGIRSNSGEVPTLDLTENSKVTVEIIVDREPVSAPIMHRFRFVCDAGALLGFAAAAAKQTVSTAKRK